MDNINEKHGIISKVFGPLIVAKNMKDVQLYDLVRVGYLKLMGEVIELRDEYASIQVYEETGGIGPGEPVYYTDGPLSVELGPGLIGSIFDGIERPLERIYELEGSFIPAGIDLPKLDRNKLWDFTSIALVGSNLAALDILGSVNETSSIVHKIMVPPNVKGKLVWIYNGQAKVDQVIAKLEDENNHIIELTMIQNWPVRIKRPFISKMAPKKPMVTGQRIIDTFFPIAQGGIAAIPGPFGSGKTVVQHQLAKWCDAEIIIYIGCGERGNEMTDVLMEFPQLIDPKTNDSLMNRTVLIANTSNMPVAAREASMYTGITIAEYFRDMGYKVAIMADSTSRWAEALREMSGRLEEMPGEEGYPAYLGSRLAEFYERAGHVKCLNGLEGSVTAIGAISPPGGDTSEPVSQATLRIVKVFWGLSASLAYKRHFPAIDWLRSYSLYDTDMRNYYDATLPNWSQNALKMLSLLQEEKSLEDIVRLVGADSLSDKDKITLLTAKSIREDFLQQDAFDDVDSFASLNKQYLLSSLIINCHNLSLEKIILGIPFLKIESLPVRDEIARFKYIKELEVTREFELISNKLSVQFKEII